MTVHNPREIRLDYTPHARGERLIATGRFVLASSSLVAVYLEPSTPAQFQRVTYSLLFVYTVYALAATVVAWRSPVPSSRWRLLSHALDLVLFSAFVYLTEGPASPFFLYFVFSLFCATVRFSWRGILVTGAAAMVIYASMAVVASWQNPVFDASRPVIRLAYLGVIAALLVYLGIYQQSLRTEMASLAAWPRGLASRVEDVLRVTLAHAASVLTASRVMLIWEESEEPWVHTAVLGPEGFMADRVAPGTYDAPPAAALPGASVFVRGGTDLALVYDPSTSAVSESSGDPLGPMLRARFGLDGAIVVPLESETLTARFVVGDVRSATADDLALAHIAGRLLLATLEQFFFVQQVRQTASAEERLRLSRELHDGIVQSLAGVGLRLRALRNEFAADPEAAGQLGLIQDVLEHDQRELRAIVRELRPRDDREGGAGLITEELERMRERFPLEWGLEVRLGSSDVPALPARLSREVCRIVNESLSNAARHGGASRADVYLSAREGIVEIRVADNGRGFPFAGTRDLEQLEASGEGPRTLKERVRRLRGGLTVHSAPGAASIEIRIPVAEEA